MSDRLKKEFESFEVKPDSKLWKEIEKNLPAKSYNIWKVASFITAGVLIISASILFFAPVKNNDIAKPNTNTIITQNSKDDIINNNVISSNQSNEITQTQSESSLQSNKITNDKIQNEIKRENSFENISKIESLNHKQNNLRVEMGIEKPQNITPSINSEEYENQTSLTINQSKSSIIEDSINNRLRLFIPNGFTPTAATNNIFKPGYVELKSYEINIFNRNGVLVFNSKDINIGWDGKYRGELCPMGVYVYIIKFENTNNYKTVQKGELNLIR